MTVDDRRGTAYPRGWRVLAGGLVAALAFGYASLGVTAQDASPGASPVAGDCVAPDLPPGTPTPMDEATPEAEQVEVTSPVAEEDIASPAAATPEGEAAPVAPEPPSGTPAEGDEADEIIAAAENIVNCINSGDAEATVALYTDNYLLEEFGTANPYDVVGFLEGFTLGEVTVDNPLTYEDGRVSADLQYQASEYQIAKDRYFLVEEDGVYRLDDTSVQDPDFDGDVAVVGLAMGENEDGSYYFTPNAETVTETEGIILQGINEGMEPHEVVAVALPEGATAADVLDGTVSDEDVVFYGRIVLEPGEQGPLLMVGVPVGVMTLVCFFPSPEGMPHAANGMIAQIEVTAAE